MPHDKFINRHIGPRESEISKMLETIGTDSLDSLIDETIPKDIRLKEKLNLPVGIEEHTYLNEIWKVASKNKVYRSYIGQGYYGTVTPAVIQRNILENPGWYTSYTPYQAEVSQGRLEALLNFQTMIVELTGMELSNCSLLDEATSAAEAMLMMYSLRPRAKAKAGANVVFVDEKTFPQTLEVIHTRAIPMDIEVVVGDYRTFEPNDKVFGAIVQYPNSEGSIEDYKEFTDKIHADGALVSAVVDLLSLVMITPPGEWGADIVVGSAQRFGVPMAFGGPHAGFLACREKYKRNVPGRIIGVSKDRNGRQALRMALQTREQHIKREKATSNICTAQALLATMASFYAAYHGKEGLEHIAKRVHSYTGFLAEKIKEFGYILKSDNYFDTLLIELPDNMHQIDVKRYALAKEINLRYIEDKVIGLSIDETVRRQDLNDLIEVFARGRREKYSRVYAIEEKQYFDKKYLRTSDFLNHDVFNRYHSETEMMRYMKKLENRDISLNHSMISLGSCTMKLNAAAEMIPITWPEFAGIHPFVPSDQVPGYYELFEEIKDYLIKVTGLAGCTLQPNSGAAGEYAGLMVIREHHISRGEGHRNVALIPASAHGTNPASAVMAGMKVVVTPCDENGNIDVEKLKELAEQHKDNLSSFMVTYPSTHGVFESRIIEMCKIIHDCGGQVYMDGANMNAQVGLTNPGLIGADVCHLNLHKTFAIPHGGGGPGVGPICVASHLVQFLPKHSVVKTGGENGITAVSAAPFGSPGVLPITYGYLRMLGEEGLRKSTEIAILNANYLAVSLSKLGFKILYTGENGRVGHEMILDCRPFKDEVGISEMDIAKRLMDFGFHAPTVSFPVYGTLMIEPTESESLQEIDRFIEALTAIKQEIEDVRSGKADKEDNVLKNAPHTAFVITNDEWTHQYTRKQAAFPLQWIEENKFWPYVGRIDDAFGDRNLMCTCAPLEDYE